MRLALFVHLISVALWIGCVIVEGIYEHSIDKSPAMRSFISRLHWNTDKFVEIPAFLVVLLSGAYLLQGRTLGGLLAAKVAFGALAIFLNAVCVWLVIRRLRHAEAGDFAGWERVDHLQHKLGGLVALAMLAALGIGGYLFVVGGA
ncbi:hypothetical protein [Eleftheria terrae]|uniref:hypothetical protein n=1 Tax=Eleftheria terrae TaxID=1597781 RepID=UPI00263B2CF3|nr:hypothetical protein [Eleftheria terrae]WKB55879.1 hypothetical protein N7L95_27775 [Eleftheria terrae]